MARQLGVCGSTRLQQQNRQQKGDVAFGIRRPTCSCPACISCIALQVTSGARKTEEPPVLPCPTLQLRALACSWPTRPSMHPPRLRPTDDASRTHQHRRCDLVVTLHYSASLAGVCQPPADKHSRLSPPPCASVPRPFDVTLTTASPAPLALPATLRLHMSYRYVADPTTPRASAFFPQPSSRTCSVQRWRHPTRCGRCMQSTPPSYEPHHSASPPAPRIPQRRPPALRSQRPARTRNPRSPAPHPLCMARRATRRLARVVWQPSPTPLQHLHILS